jgi:hypothetical protein
MEHREKLIAVLKLLQTSIDNNLNASLTPEDCQLLLTIMSQAHRASQLSKRPSPSPSPPPPVNRGNHVDRIIESIFDLGKSVIDDLTDEIRPRKRR